MAAKNNSRGPERPGPGCELLSTEPAHRLIKTVDNSTRNMTCQDERAPNVCIRGDGSETVCRICFVELSEGESFRIECCCKGDLAAAHSDCAARWFAIRGKGSCDVCGHAVRNLSPLLERRKNRKRSTTTTSFDCDGDGRRRQQLEDDHELIRNISWMEVVAVYLSCALASLWRKLEELSEFP